MSMSDEFQKKQDAFIAKAFKKPITYTGKIVLEKIGERTYYKIKHPIKSNIFIKNHEGLSYKDNGRVVDFTLETVSMGQDYGGNIYIDYATLL